MEKSDSGMGRLVRKKIAKYHLNYRDKNNLLKERFQPFLGEGSYLVFMRKGKYYVYEGKHEVDELHKFAVEDYELAKKKGIIPSEPTLT